MGKGGLSRDHTHSDIDCALLMELQKIVIEWSLILYVSDNYHYSVSNQLIGWKSNPIFRQLNYLIEGTVALIQWVDNIEQCSDV